MKKQLLETLKKAESNTLAVAEAMPEMHYTFKPSGGGWNFAELLNHIGYGIQWWEDNYLLGRETEWEQPVLSNDKDSIKSYLKKCFRHFEDTCKNLSLEEEKELHGFHSTLDHLTHHRGQAVVYLRCQGQTPPEYIY